MAQPTVAMTIPRRARPIPVPSRFNAEVASWMMKRPMHTTAAMALIIPRSSSKLAPPNEIDVADVICDHSQLIAESAVLPKAVATLENTELVTEEPR